MVESGLVEQGMLGEATSALLEHPMQSSEHLMRHLSREQEELSEDEERGVESGQKRQHRRRRKLAGENENRL